MISIMPLDGLRELRQQLDRCSVFTKNRNDERWPSMKSAANHFTCYLAIPKIYKKQ